MTTDLLLLLKAASDHVAKQCPSRVVYYFGNDPVILRHIAESENNTKQLAERETNDKLH